MNYAIADDGFINSGASGAMFCTYCKDHAEINMSWLVHKDGLDRPPVRQDMNLCGNCASQLWNNPKLFHAAIKDTVIIQELI